MVKTKRIWSVALFAIIATVAIGITTPSRPVYAASADVIINEIMYNPASGNNADEYIELHNTTDSDINIGNWFITAGAGNNIGSGTILPARGYVLISPSPTQTLATYGKSTVATYAGQLSNGGGTITLRDAVNNVVNSVTYDDASPWPLNPDGHGPSLELKDPELDNSLASSWGTSITITPGEQNSWVGISSSIDLSDISSPTNVNEGDAVTITAKSEDADTLSLSYKVMFGADQTIPMYDDGLNGDGAAGDGVYGAQIPSQAAGQLVRFKIIATNSSGGRAASPDVDDSQRYHGYVVRDPSVTSSLPIVQWFMSDADYQDMHENHATDNLYLKSVIAYGDQVIDNTDVRIKGEFSRSFPKKGYKFKLPRGNKISMPGHLQRDVSEFHMNGEWLDESKAMTATVWQIAEEIGIDVPSIFGTRLQRNGQYEGYYLLAEKYEKEFRQDKGYDGELYEDLVEKVQPDDGNLLPAEIMRDTFWAPRTQARRDYLFDNIDIPKLNNFAAFESLINSHDWGIHNNQFQYHDVNGTGRWWFMPWDRDIVMLVKPANITPYTVPPYFGPRYRIPTTSLYYENDGRQMFFRRLRTLADEYFGNDNRFLTMYRANVALSAPEAALDIAKWGTSDGADGLWTNSQNEYEYNINRQKKDLLVRYRLDRAVPNEQDNQPNIEINQVHVDIDPEKSFVKLYNPLQVAVDISGWRLTQADYTFPQGTVIAAGGYAITPRSDPTYRSLNSGEFITSELANNLSPTGQITLERSDASQADSVWY